MKKLVMTVAAATTMLFAAQNMTAQETTQDVYKVLIRMYSETGKTTPNMFVLGMPFFIVLYTNPVFHNVTVWNSLL